MPCSQRDCDTCLAECSAGLGEAGREGGGSPGAASQRLLRNLGDKNELFSIHNNGVRVAVGAHFLTVSASRCHLTHCEMFDLLGQLDLSCDPSSSFLKSALLIAF